MSLEASTKACSTFTPDLALASTKSSPSCLAHSSASSYVTSRALRFTFEGDMEDFVGLTVEKFAGVAVGAAGVVDMVPEPEVGAVPSDGPALALLSAGGDGSVSSQRSTLFPTNMHVT